MSLKSELELFPKLLKLTPLSEKILDKSVKTKFFNEQEIVINKGDEVSGIVLVLSGCLRVYTINSNGKESTLYDIKAGESCVLAMNCVFSNLLYPAWVCSSSPHTKVLIINSSAYKELYEKESTIRSFTIDILSQRIFNLMTVIEEALSFNVEQRIVSFLLRKSNNAFDVYTSHQVIASEVGTAREVVSRILKNMEDKGLIVLSRGKINILSVNKLNSICLE